MSTNVRRIPELSLVPVRREAVRKEPHAPATTKDPYVAKALAVMRAEPATRFTVSSLARRVGLSRQAFARRFVASVGESPLRHLTRLRMERAAGMLEATDEGLAAIAIEVGYDSEYAFNRAFKRWSGTPPGRFRREARRSTAVDAVSTTSSVSTLTPPTFAAVTMRPFARAA